MKICKSVGCSTVITQYHSGDFCASCTEEMSSTNGAPSHQPSMSELYPKYYKDFSGVDEADVYMVHDRFNIQDPSGCIHHASKKLLLSGVRTGGKTKFDDIREARDTLNRWLEINKDRKELQ